MVLSDGVSEIFLIETVFLPSQRGLTGLAISENNKRMLSWFGLVVLIGVVGFFVFRAAKMFRKRTRGIEVHPKKRQFIEFEY